METRRCQTLTVTALALTSLVRRCFPLPPAACPLEDVHPPPEESRGSQGPGSFAVMALTEGNKPERNKRKWGWCRHNYWFTVFKTICTSWHCFATRNRALAKAARCQAAATTHRRARLLVECLCPARTVGSTANCRVWLLATPLLESHTPPGEGRYTILICWMTDWTFQTNQLSWSTMGTTKFPKTCGYC